MKTPEIRLRAMEPEDLDLLYSIENDSQLWNVGTNNVPYSRYLLHDYIATSTGDIYADRQVRLIVENQAKETVGLADLVNFDAKNCRAEVGIAIVCRHRHCGYGHQALTLLTDYARRVLHLHQLYAIVDPANEASCQAFLKAGFIETARLKDWLYDGRQYHDAVLVQLLRKGE